MDGLRQWRRSTSTVAGESSSGAPCLRRGRHGVAAATTSSTDTMASCLAPLGRCSRNRGSSTIKRTSGDAACLLTARSKSVSIALCVNALPVGAQQCSAEATAARRSTRQTRICNGDRRDREASHFSGLVSRSPDLESAGSATTPWCEVHYATGANSPHAAPDLSMRIAST